MVNLFYCFRDHNLHRFMYFPVDVGLGIWALIFFLLFFILKVKIKKKRLAQEKSGLKITYILQRCHDSCQKGMDVIKHNLINIQETVTGVEISVKCEHYLIYSYLSISSAMVHNDDPFSKYHFTYWRTRVTLSIRVTEVT